MFNKSSHRKPGQDGPGAMPSIVARNLRILGNLDSDGDIQVDGAVEGDIRTGRLTIGESGRVRGAIEAETVTVAGAVTGSIKAKSVSLLRTARVIADIAQDQLTVESGAVFEGNSRRFTKEEPARARIEPVASMPVVLKVAGGTAKPEAGGG